MSPEQIRGKVSPASDYYSMGIIFYELLLGNPPFVGDSAMVILSAHAFQKPPKVKEKNPDIPDEISDLIAALLVKRPENISSAIQQLPQVIKDLFWTTLFFHE